MTRATPQHQHYDPVRLVNDIIDVLQARGLNPELKQRPAAQAAAGRLLRTLGITPGMDGVDALARAMDKPWGGQDEC